MCCVRSTLHALRSTCLFLLAAALFAATQGAFAGANTNLPFTDTFEAYTNLTPLTDGTNGWYGSSYSIDGTNIMSIVQTNIVRTGTKAAMIPVDCTLSNRFTGIPRTNIWAQMDLRPSFYDSTNNPVVDTNVAVMFFINTNGYFVVHNGPATNTSPTNSASWVTATNNIQISTNATNWVTVGIYEDFTKTNWDLYAKTNWSLPDVWVLVTNNIRFVNTNLTNFAGFDVYNGATTSYLDNVYVTNANAGPAAKVNVETAANGSGTNFTATNLPSGSNLTAYAITRDVSDNFVANVAADSWALTNITGGVVAGNLVASGDNKSAIFTGVVTGSANIRAVSGSLTTNVSGTITVISGTATKVNVETAANGNGTIVPATNLVSGSNLTVYAITRDASDNFVTNVAAGSWALLDITGGVVAGNLVANVDMKSAVFTGALTGTAKIAASSAALPIYASGVITVTTATASKLAYKIVPSTGTVGTAFSVTVESRDAAGNPANVVAGTTITLSKATGLGTLSGTLAGTITAGSSNVTIATPVYSKSDTMTLTATASGGDTLTAVTSGNIVFSAGAATQVAFTTQPSTSTVAGVAFAQQPVVEIRDASSNLVTTATSNVVLTLSAGTGALGGTANMNAVGGIANFTGKGLNINRIGADKKLTATVTGLNTATTEVFTITVATVTIAGAFTVSNKVYDGNTTATIVNNSLTTNGVLAGADAVSLVAVATFNNATAGTGKPVTLAGSSLSGADAANYTLSLAGAPGTFADITQTNQTITFLAIPAQPSGNLTLTLSATASSGLTVSFTNTSVLGTNIVGSILTFNGIGQYTIMAFQTGNVNYAAAASVSQSFPVYNSAAAPTTNTIPWSDDFDGNKFYYLNTPLILGTNGWYGSSNSILVQNTIYSPFSGGTQAAMIPVDCTLSNRFANIAPTNVWIQMDLRPSFYDSTNNPVVDTNVAMMFFINTNGYFVVHNGPATNLSPTNSASWVTATNNIQISTNATNWVTIGIYEDFTKTNWDLYAKTNWDSPAAWVLVTNNIRFVNTNLTNFAGFDVYNGATTSYLDNVYVTNANAGPASKVNVETAANGSGTNFTATNLISGSNLTVFAITRDVSGNFVANVAADSWALTNNTGGVVAGNLVASGDNKSAIFTGVVTGSANIRAVLGSLTTNISGTITVISGTASKVNVETAANGSGTIVPLQSLASGSALTGYAITRDAANNFVTNVAADSWALIAKTGGVIDGNLAPAVGNSNAVFTGVLIGTAKIQAVSDGLSMNASAVITVTTGPASKLAYKTVPSTGTAGTAFSVTVESRDTAGNPANLASATTITLSKATGGGTLSGVLAGSIGIGTSNVTIATPVYSKSDTMTLTATASGGVALTPVTSGDIVFSAGVATHVAFTTQPSASTVAGVAFAQQPVVTIRDAFSNTVTTASSNVALRISTGTGALGGTTNMNAASGVATFSGLNIDLVGADKVLTAEVTGLTSATTTPAFAITPAAASHVAFTTQPSASTVAGVAFAQQPVVTIRDAFSNTVTTASSNVALRISTGTGALGGTTNMNAASGVATFSGLNIDLVGADKVLTAEVTGLTSTTTTPTFAITLAAASMVRVETAANGSGTIVPLQNLISGSNLTGYAITRDPYTNFVANVAADSWALINMTNGVVAGNLVTNVNMKSAVFTGAVTGSANIRAVSVGLTTNISGLITVISGTASNVYVEIAADGSGGTNFPATNLPSGSALTVYAITRDAANNFVTNVTADFWALTNITGGVVAGDLALVSGMKSAIFTGAVTGSAQIRATSGSLTTNFSGVITVTNGAVSKVNVETAADGSGTIVPLQNLISGSNLTAYAITRDAANNFVTNVAATSWALTNITGGVVAGDLVPAGGMKSAVFTGVATGSAQIRATSGSLTTNFSGVITVIGGNATVAPTTAAHTLGATTTLAITLTPYGRTLKQITSSGTGSLLVENTDYTVAGNVYTILAAYLNAQSAGAMTLTFVMNGGTDPTTVVTVSAPAPPGLTASKGAYTDKVALSWTAAAGAVGYEVWRNTSSDTNTATKVSSPDVTGASYNDTGAANAVLYTYWVKTKWASGVAGVFSASDTGWRAVPSSSVSASRGLRREVKVTWSVSAGATSYALWKNSINESNSATMLTNTTATLYRDMAVIPGTSYYYWVKAFCALGDSGWGTSSEGWCGSAKWDFNGDGRAEPWYYNEQSGSWYVMMTTNEMSTTVWGGAGWVPALGDYDRDGKTDLAVYNCGDSSTGSGQGGTLKILMSGSGWIPMVLSEFGGVGYTPAVGDYDGDGKADPAIYVEASGTWQIAMSGSGYELVTGSGLGGVGYKAVPMDYDGDGKTDPAVQEEASGNWFILLSGSNGQSTNVQFGMSGYVPVPGEYDGLGYVQIAVYNEASGNWYIRGNSNTVYFGMSGYLPIPADYDGDRYDDEAVFYRDSYDAIWHLLMSTEGSSTISGRMSRP